MPPRSKQLELILMYSLEEAPNSDSKIIKSLPCTSLILRRSRSFAAYAQGSEYVTKAANDLDRLRIRLVVYLQKGFFFKEYSRFKSCAVQRQRK